MASRRPAIAAMYGATAELIRTADAGGYVPPANSSRSPRPCS